MVVAVMVVRREKMALAVVVAAAHLVVAVLLLSVSPGLRRLILPIFRLPEERKKYFFRMRRLRCSKRVERSMSRDLVVLRSSWSAVAAGVALRTIMVQEAEPEVSCGRRMFT